MSIVVVVILRAKITTLGNFGAFCDKYSTALCILLLKHQFDRYST